MIQIQNDATNSKEGLAKFKISEIKINMMINNFKTKCIVNIILIAGAFLKKPCTILKRYVLIFIFDHHSCRLCSTSGWTCQQHLWNPQLHNASNRILITFLMHREKIARHITDVDGSKWVRNIFFITAISVFSRYGFPSKKWSNKMRAELFDRNHDWWSPVRDATIGQ